MTTLPFFLKIKLIKKSRRLHIEQGEFMQPTIFLERRIHEMRHTNVPQVPDRRAQQRENCIT